AQSVPWVVVPDARAALASIAAEFYGHPSRAMQVVGITGTNGKTTTAYLLRAVFEAAGKKCGLLGTVSYSVGDREMPAARTTPEAPDVQRMFRQMVDAGCGACVMEVSSHALALRRVDDTTFAAGVFTNLTRDHLDYHGDMESYFAAKRRLFDMLPAGAPAVVNLDDPRGEALKKIVPAPVTYAINKTADVTPGPLTLTFQGLEFDARTPKGTVHVLSKLVGRPNVSNILATVATATALDIPGSAIERGLASLGGVPGRFQLVSSANDDVTVVIDYAHTDDALKNLLETARPLAPRRVITVFGCGGDRDRTKRPLMGAVASRLSDVVVMTSDNPRTEDPVRIIEEIKRGIPSASDRGAATFVIVDRKEAIQFAIKKAEPGDLVLLAGKGHEQTQMIGSQELPFDEAAIAREALERRR
ncbi:MAG TPA: UDP-N-acetylmuramoyl-L-alanyl-D-glutamate--2,6-diaminopimelate ligase, partial [Vicinamibacterales bacterium]|nr:UDP-N-acetylmuramoyl-L-alanyl-D-glutamate--2,6-diaminopimelate ligase [Vicinamibacterales bacterium]